MVDCLYFHVICGRVIQRNFAGVVFSFIERGIHGNVPLSTSFNIGTSNNILFAEV